MIKRVLYYILLFTSVVLLVLVFQHIDKCEGESYGKVYAVRYVKNLLTFNVFFLLFQFIILGIDTIVVAIKLRRNKKERKKELYFVLVSIGMLLIWYFIKELLSKNGHCDVIIGPGDTGKINPILARNLDLCKR